VGLVQAWVLAVDLVLALGQVLVVD